MSDVSNEAAGMYEGVDLLREIKRSLDRWGYCNLDKRSTISDETAKENGWVVIRGRVMLDVVMHARSVLGQSASSNR